MKLDDYELTGVGHLKDAAPSHKRAIIFASGPTLSEVGEEDLKKMGRLPIFGINEVVRDFEPDWWITSDQTSVTRYAKYVKTNTRVLTTHRACHWIEAALPEHVKGDTLLSVLAAPQVQEYDNPFEFYSRRTTAIAAIEFLRYAGFKTIYVFGLDHFCTDSMYYYFGNDGMKRPKRTPKVVQHYKGDRVKVTPTLEAGAVALESANEKLWDKIDVVIVNSPMAMIDGFEHLTKDEFYAEIEKDAKFGRGRKPANNWTGARPEKSGRDQEDAAATASGHSQEDPGSAVERGSEETVPGDQVPEPEAVREVPQPDLGNPASL